MREAITGYKILKNEGKLDFWLKLLDSITHTRLNNANLPFFLLRKNRIDPELSIRQFIFVSVIYKKIFYKELLRCIANKKSLRYPLPRELQSIVINTEQIQVNKLSCSILWFGYSFLMWVYGFYNALKSMCYLLRKHKKLGRYIYFHDLVPSSIPSDNKSHTIVNWYFHWKNRANNIDTIGHSIRNSPHTNYSRTDIKRIDEVPYLNGIQIIKYYFWFILLLTYSLFVFLFNPYPAIMLNESIKLMRARLAKKNQLGRDYIFNVSNAYYRPLWTYEVEIKGSRVLFYFYSINNRVFKTSSDYPIQYPWHLMSWSYYLVWDAHQVDFVKRFAYGKPIIEKVGHIWFSSSEECLDIPSNSVAVFDITPFRPSIFILMGISLEYYIFNTSNQFLSDIQVVLSQNNFQMAHKMKRITKMANKRYTKKLTKLVKKPNYLKINPSNDALQVIRKTKACISMPFTSTALIAKEEGRPSIYYDPTGIIHKDDKAAHGILVLSGISELKQWVQGLDR